MSTTTIPDHDALHRPDADAVIGAIAKRSYATLATTSDAGRPHVAGVLYEYVDDALYVSTLRNSRKARNIATTPHAAVVVPIRRVPVGGPPSAVQFQGRAELLDGDSPEIAALVAAGKLGSITGHGELDLPDGCFIRVEMPARLHTYGLGMSLMTLVRDPLGAAGLVERN
ncbi:MAG: pyridoxamine 5'-phosphate oxidase family protein [Actinomycetota bacterium]